MTLVEEARDRLKYTGARKPLLVIGEDKLTQFLTETCDRHPPLIDDKKRFDGVPFRCVPSMKGMYVLDLDP